MSHDPKSSPRPSAAQPIISLWLAGLTPNARGALWMLGSALAFTLMTTLVKFMGAGYSASVQTFYRQAAAVLVLLPIMANDWRGSFATTRPWILLFRSSAGTLAMTLGFYAFQKLPLADANALSFTRTLWLVPLAGFVLGERLGPLRIGASVVGFVGVLVMLRPTGSGAVFGLPQIAALSSAFLFALTITGMKVMTRDHKPFTLLVWSAVLGLVFSVPMALLSWRWPTLMDLALLIAMGVLGVIAQGFYIKGMQIGDAAAMAPIDYMRLVFAVMMGILVFHDVPKIATIIGAGVVVAATLFITWRENRDSRRAAALAELGAD
jgi:drug/metabolite transporter (DMT)-like permease